MDFLRRAFQKYSGPIRGFKGVYVINNLLQFRKLRHNVGLYKKYGIDKSVLSPISSSDFGAHHPDIPWLDQPDAWKRAQKHPDFAKLPAAQQALVKQFINEGYFVLRGFYNAEKVEALNAEVDRLLSEKKADFNYSRRKIMDAWQLSDLVDQAYFRNPELLQLLNFLMGKKVIPFQTIHFVEGSEQKAHSDSIHMTTEPLGYLIAAWTALEKVHDDNGPLFYYPGSHRFPYLLCEDYDSGNTTWKIGPESYKHYEEAVAAFIEREGLKKEIFHAEPGDVLVWHANLLHGGSPINQPGLTRRSMVAHYFCEEVICYHEISQRPALMG